MKCPYCSSIKSKVVDKRDNNEEATTRRRRECLKCAKRYTTYERIENIDLTVIKKDGSAQQFNREKLARSIGKSASDEIITEEAIEKIVGEIETRLLNRKNTHVTSTEIGNMILTRLKNTSPVAYMRFASVYKGFETLKDLEEELASLKSSTR